jgi:hypothetical protein
MFSLESSEIFPTVVAASSVRRTGELISHSSASVNAPWGTGSQLAPVDTRPLVPPTHVYVVACDVNDTIATFTAAAIAATRILTDVITLSFRIELPTKQQLFTERRFLNAYQFCEHCYPIGGIESFL